MVDTEEQTNSVIGTTQVTIKVRDIDGLDAILKQVEESDGLAAKICSIDISGSDKDVDDDDEEEEEEEEATAEEPQTSSANTASDNATDAKDLTEVNEADEAAKKASDEAAARKKRIAERRAQEEKGTQLAARRCAPLIRLLDTIRSHGGSLKHFSWWDSWYGGGPFTRPQAFWTALFAHCATLESLKLDFFEHEVKHFAAPETTFPALKKLVVDAGSGHGDDGTGVDALLKSCPNLLTLYFAWPGCDLNDCQIQKVSWDFTFPALTRLELNGYNFAPEPLAAFLARHSNVETLNNAIGYYRSEDSASPPYIADAVLPQLRALKKSGEAKIAAYFDESTQRPLRHLRLISYFSQGCTVAELARLESARTGLKVLEIEGNIRDWRPEEESSDEEEEEEGKGADAKENKISSDKEDKASDEKEDSNNEVKKDNDSDSESDSKSEQDRKTAAHIRRATAVSRRLHRPPRTRTQLGIRRVPLHPPRREVGIP